MMLEMNVVSAGGSFLLFFLVLVIPFVESSSECSDHHHHYPANASRVLSHQGLSYDTSASQLRHKVDNYLRNSMIKFVMGRAVIVPHANLNMSGDVAAMAFRQVQSGAVYRMFVIGPSHDFNFDYCMLSPAAAYQTPYGYDFPIDKKVYARLMATGRFRYLDHTQDEMEHSIEDTLPFLGRLMEIFPEKPTIVPIITGDFSYDDVAFYGRLLAPYLSSQKNLFVISSDFCHWGKKYNFTYRNGSASVPETIERLDRLGMAAIETLDPIKFDEYIEKHKNTICGEEAIRILMHMTTHLRHMRPQLKFVDYKISEDCSKPTDTCVSYAAASLIFHNETYQVPGYQS